MKTMNLHNDWVQCIVCEGIKIISSYFKSFFSGKGRSDAELSKKDLDTRILETEYGLEELKVAIQQQSSKSYRNELNKEKAHEDALHALEIRQKQAQVDIFEARAREAKAKAEAAEIELVSKSAPQDSAPVVDNNDVVSQEESSQSKNWIEYARETFKLPKVLPPLLAPLVNACPPDFKIPMLAHLVTVCGALCCSKVRAKDSRGIKQSPTLGVIIEAPTGSGKSMFQSAYEALFSDIIRADADKVNSKEKSQTRIIQIQNANTSTTALIGLLSANQGLHTYMFAPEISEMTELAKGKNKAFSYEFYRKNFDNDWFDFSSSHNQGRYSLFTNMTFTGTTDAVSRFAGPKQVEDGSANRFMFFAIPGREINETRNFILPEESTLEDLRENVKILHDRYCYWTDPDGNDSVREICMVNLSYMNDAIRKWRDKQIRKTWYDDNKSRMDIIDRYGTMAFRCAMVLHVLFFHFCPSEDTAKVQDHVSELSLLIAEYALERYLNRFKEALNKIRQLEVESGLRPNKQESNNEGPREGPKISYELALELKKKQETDCLGLRKLAEWAKSEFNIDISHTAIGIALKDLESGKTW